MNLFYTWGAILGPYAAGVVYDRTESYALVRFQRDHRGTAHFHCTHVPADQALGKSWNDRLTV
jgi:hypothetical protein